MAEELNLVDKDAIKIERITGLLDELLVQFVKKMPDSSKRGFRKAYERHAQLYSVKLAKLLQTSVETQYSTPTGRIRGALLDRIIISYQAALAGAIKHCRTGNPAHAAQADDLFLEVKNLLHLAKSIQCDPALDEHGSFLFREVNPSNGGERINTTSEISSAE